MTICRGYRIVGTEKKLIDLYKGELIQGKQWNKPYEVVVGYKVYEKLKNKTRG